MNAAAISTASTTLRSALELFVLVMLYLHKIKMRNYENVVFWGKQRINMFVVWRVLILLVRENEEERLSNILSIIEFIIL
jgi:hypothetical protein